MLLRSIEARPIENGYKAVAIGSNVSGAHGSSRGMAYKEIQLPIEAHTIIELKAAIQAAYPGKYDLSREMFYRTGSKAKDVIGSRSITLRELFGITS